MNSSKISSYLNNVVVVASLALLVALAFEIAPGRGSGFSAFYSALEGVVCATYIFKFFFDMSNAHSKRRFLSRRFFVLALSIPYLAIASLIGVKVGHNYALVLGLMPIARAMISFYRLFMRLVSAQSIDKILLAYLMVTVLFSYIAALIFYDCEAHVNPALKGLGNAIWWAWMGLTTVGAAIYPVTTVGKILSVVLPLVGMMLLPLFTSYIIALHKRRG